LGLDVKGQTIEHIMTYLAAVKNTFKNMRAFLTATDGIVLKDMAAFLAATDGITLKDVALFMQVINASPVFRTRISQRMTSIAHEVI